MKGEEQMSFLTFWLILFVPLLLAAVCIELLEFAERQCEIADERARRKYESISGR